MSDPRSELADLAADVLAALEDVESRGVRAEPIPSGGPAPTPEPLPRVSPPPHSTQTAASAAPRLGVASAAGDAWSRLADQARRDAGQWSASGEEALRRIREDLGDCRRCPLHSGRRNIVFGAGAPDADLAIVGEAPGRQEDLTGVPFVGPAGQMLDRMLENVLGLTRDQVHILNVVKCRPPRNRNPLPEEVDACLPFLERQLEAIQPRVLLVLGTVALKVLFRTESGITRHRGTWMEFRGIAALPTFHPAYLLRNPEQKRPVFADLKALRKRYDELGGRR